MTGDAFAAWVEQSLAPTLKRGECVILDNVAPHKDERIERLVHRTGAKVLSLPPSSPDLNPIENADSKLKTLLRKAASKTFETLCATLAEALDRFSLSECQNYIRQCIPGSQEEGFRLPELRTRVHLAGWAGIPGFVGSPRHTIGGWKRPSVRPARRTFGQ